MAISILIPAFRPAYLRQALASALAQGREDVEVHVGDDSGADEVRAVVEAFRDPRLRYHRTPGRIGGAENCRRLWDSCRTQRMMFLFDDDVLMPHAVTELSDALDRAPAATFSFGLRYLIDADGRVTGAPPAVPRHTVFDGETLSKALVGSVVNHVGELSNVLIDRRTGLGPDDLLRYAGLDLHVVADVGFYLNATRRGPAVRAGLPVAAFRRHAEQNSQPEFNPKFAIGIVEWELFIRGEYDAGRLPQAEALQAVDKLLTAYSRWSQGLPAIGQMTPGLQTLRDRIAGGGTEVLDAAFKDAWAAFVDTVLNPAAA